MIRASGARGSGFDPRSGPARFFFLPFLFPSLLLNSMIKNKILNKFLILLQNEFNHRLRIF